MSTMGSAKMPRPVRWASLAKGTRMKAKALGVVGLLLLSAAWVVVLRGLFLLPVSNSPELDLEAGPAFAINISVYLPALALSLLLLVALPVSVAAGRGAAVGAVAGLAVSVFALWVLTQHALLDYFPGLTAALSLATGLGIVGILAYLAAYALHPREEDADAEGMVALQDS